MSDTIIKVKELGKKYIISHQGAVGSYSTMREIITKSTQRFLKKSQKKQSKEEFWALRDVSFEVKKGEAVGIIGRNGAGKSTLLKILSRITEPTLGRIELNGRVASLLEVGTGFHPELTGRENIFLNGAILGMSRIEIRQKFDEIVDFSGVEKFLDTPVKRYSSGMYVRLAFAVAAHLEPEILVVDEVLAVGDAEFQKKCLGKMDEVAKNKGRTILFVSHNLAAIQNLCPNSIWLHKGEMFAYAPSSDVVSSYLSEKKAVNNLEQNQNKEIYISGFEAFESDNQNIFPGSNCIFKVVVTSRKEVRKVHIGIGINDKLGNRIVTPFTACDYEGFDLKEGVNNFFCSIDSLPLKPDVYDVHLYVGNAFFEPYDYISDSIQFEVHPYPYFKFSMPNPSHGPLILKQKWYKND